MCAGQALIGCVFAGVGAVAGQARAGRRQAGRAGSRRRGEGGAATSANRIIPTPAAMFRPAVNASRARSTAQQREAGPFLTPVS